MQQKFKPNFAFHPGETLKDKLEEMKMSVADFAQKIALPEAFLIDFIYGKSNITPDFAVLLEDALKIPARYWINSQKMYEQVRAENAHTQP